MIRRMLKEIVDNSIDEALAGRNTHVETVINIANNEYIVADSGGGIPVGKHKEEKVSVLELLFSSLHAGGKFDDAAYKTSSGTHGVGAACTNALSDVFTIYTQRDSVWYTQSYEKGVKKTEVSRIKLPPKEITARLQKTTKEYGTIIRFIPDQTVVSIDATDARVKPKNFTPAKLDVRAFVEWTRMIALFNPGLKMVTSFEDKKKTATFHNTKGLEAVVNHIIEKNELSRVAKPFVLQTESLDVAIQWTSYDELDLFNTYVNCGRTRDHGKHFDGFRDALQRALTLHKGKTDKFKTIDAMYGMVGALNYKMSGAEFSSQTKDRLTSNVGKAVEETVYDALVAFFDKNKTLAKTIIKRAMAITKGRDELKKVMKSVTDVKKSGKGALLPNNLVVSSTKDPMKRELFCFTADTPVALLDGGHKTFAELVSDWEQGIVNVGVAWDCAKGNSAPAVLHHPRVTRYVTELVEVTLDDGSTFRCTADHPWLLENGVFADACDLAPGDFIREVQLAASHGATSGS